MAVTFLPKTTSQVKTFEIPLKLHAKQKEIDNSQARFRIIRAGRKFGKSTYAEYSCIKKLGQPNSTVFFIAPTYRQGKLISWKDFKTLIPREVMARKPNETDLVITLKNGSELYVMGSDNEDSLRGPNPNHVVMEEAAMQKAETWHEILRPSLTSKQGTADFITTPKGYNWFKKFEDDARKLKHAGSKDWDVFHYSIYDNPHINRDEIESARNDCDSEAVWNQEYMANYESSVGRVFSAFNDETHCRTVDVPQSRTDVYRGIDYGMRDDTACLWGTVRSGVLYIYREHLQNDTPATVQAGLILNKTTENEIVKRNVISHDAAKQDADMRGLTVKWHFENAGIRPMYLSSRDKKSSRHMIQTLIHENRLVVDPNKCPKLREQILGYEWNDTLMEKPVDGKDDAVDALHYLVELLQAELYLNKHIEQSDAEKYAQIKSELLAQRTEPRKWKINSREELSSFDFEDSQAGYFQ